MPLGVLEKQGFDVDRIQREVTDTFEDKVLGLCYRVWLYTEAFSQIDEMAWTKMLEARRDIKALKRRKTSSASSDKDDVSVTGTMYGTG